MDVARYPPGYLNLLLSNSRGKAIPQAADIIQPVVDIGPFLGSSVLDTATASIGTGVTAAGYNPVLTVPQGEVWLVRAASCYVSTGAAGNVNDGAAYVTLAASASIQTFLSGTVQTLAASRAYMIALGSMPLWLPPGAGFGFFCVSCAQTAITYAALIERLKA